MITALNCDSVPPAIEYAGLANYPINTEYNTTLSYTCLQGYRLEYETTPLNIICDKDGVWTRADNNSCQSKSEHSEIWEYLLY